MSTPSRITESVRYDQTRGSITLHNGHASLAAAEYTNVEAVAEALQTMPIAQWIAPYFAGYALALAARAWAERPSDARRGAMIQASEQLGNARPESTVLQRWLAECLAHADSAVFANENAETTLVAFVAAAAQQADRRAERCGRRAAELIQADDCVLVVGKAALALSWMLAVAAEQPQYQLVVASEKLLRATQEISRAAELFSDEQIAAGFADDRFTLCVTTTAHVARDGSTAAHEAQRYAMLAQQHRVPMYALADRGPDAHIATGADLPSVERIAPELINAIVTDRGIYRAAMIARYNEDGDAPLDVIPLTG